MAEGKAAAVIARLGQINREVTDRRAMRERRAAEARQQAKDSMQKQGQLAERATKHLAELARRQRSSGGWVTEKALADKDKVMGFGPEEDEQQDEFARYSGYSSAPSAPQPPPPPADPHAQPEPQERKYSRSVAPPPPPEPEPERAPAPQPRRAPRHARREQSFDDDDFSNNSWLT